MREDKIKWKKVGYYLGISAGSAQKEFKRKLDIEELGEIPVIKKRKFDTPVVLKLKQMARENPKLAIREFGANLGSGATKLPLDRGHKEKKWSFVFILVPRKKICL